MRTGEKDEERKGIPLCSSSPTTTGVVAEGKGGEGRTEGVNKGVMRLCREHSGENDGEMRRFFSL